MGAVSSISKDVSNIINESQDDSSEYEFRLLKAIKDKKDKNQSQSQNESTINTKNEIKEEKIPFKFEWKEGGNKVLITGSFLNNWKIFQPMIKNLYTGIYEIIINLSKGIHQFKFIIDDKWKCSHYYRIIYDTSNNPNNFIDLTNYANSKYNKKKKQIKSNKNNTIEYNCYFPKVKEINADAPNLPINYKQSFNLNFQTNQEILQNNFYMPISLNKNRTIIENESFKTIIAISHEKLSHLFFNNEENENDETYIRSAVTQRNKQKYITIVYFSPKK